MSSARGGGGVAATTGAAAAAPIPAGYAKLVKRLKEIVTNSTDAEIYAMLRECNMDADEAAQRLLSQDTFHEVKSKRDKKKEVKEPPEPRSRSVNSSSGRGNRSTADRGGRNSSSQSSTSEYGVTRSKPTSKKENGTNSIPTSSILESTIATSNPARRSTFPSNYASTETTMQATSFPDGYSSSLQPSSGFQNNWLGKPGQVSMADIVKMGKPQGKPSIALPPANDGSYMGLNPAMLNMSNHDYKQSSTSVIPLESEEREHASEDMLQAIDMCDDLGTTEHLHFTHDGWSLVDEQPTRSMPETSDSKAFTSPSFDFDGDNANADHVEEIQLLQENFNSRSLDIESKAVPVSDRTIEEEASGDFSDLDDGLLKNSNSYQSHSHTLEHHEGSNQMDVSIEVSSATADLRQLSLHEETSTKPTESNSAVIIPSHLRVTNADCAHLSFGSFNSGTFAGSFATNPLNSNLDVASVADDASSTHQTNSRNLEHYDGQIKPIVAENLDSRTGISPENVDMPSASQSEVLRSDALDATHELQYNIPSASYSLSNTSEPNPAAYNYLHGTAQMQNLSTLSSLMQQNSLQSSLLSPNLPALRDVDLQFSPLLAAQSLSAKYNTAVSSISGPTISMPEAAKPSIFSNHQSTPQSFTSTAIPTGPTLPQHLAVHHYSQPALPLGHFANMLSYPFLPQSYTYLPSAAFQQAYSSNSPFHQSTASVPNAGIKYSLPQYKSSVPVTNLPQSANVASAYGGFGSSINMPGNFSINPSTASASTTIGFDEALGFQYKEPSHYMPLQQNDWVHGTGSRTLSSLPANTFYSYQGQIQHGGFRQSQQPSQLGAVGYSDFYHSQAGASQDHQPNPNEGNLSSSQTAPSQPAHQIWQHSY